ncbi:Uncharacterized protein TCM_022623 [Theobroma cacao]|uniref:Uncharacterized protein n=1 Tax=Theobroma cacao TaxID=3641 RepID=A0A061EU02_THECC|nr:Uncharacterized protein TCM_022623 [Theobroma cacao]
MGTKYTDEEAARPVGFKFETVDLSLSLSSLKVYNGRLRLKFLLHCIGSSTRKHKEETVLLSSEPGVPQTSWDDICQETGGTQMLT